MNNIREDYLKFDVGGSGDNPKDNMFGSAVKILVIILLLLLVLVLGALAYKFLFGGDGEKNIAKSTQPIQQSTPKVETKPVAQVTQQANEQESNLQKQVTQQVQNSSSGLKKEEIAMIVQSVLAQIEQKQAQPVVNNTVKQETQTVSNSDTVSNNNDIESDDSDLLNSLQAVSVDSVERNEIDTSRIGSLDANQKVKDSSSKKEDTFNKVIVENKNRNTQDDLSKLYSQLNQIMQKDKTREKDKTYVTNLKKETKVRENEMRIITVKKGDTLSKIASRAYGNPMMYNKIFEANPDLITDPNRIYPGQRLRVPK